MSDLTELQLKALGEEIEREFKAVQILFRSNTIASSTAAEERVPAFLEKVLKFRKELEKWAVADFGRGVVVAVSPHSEDGVGRVVKSLPRSKLYAVYASE